MKALSGSSSIAAPAQLSAGTEKRIGHVILRMIDATSFEIQDGPQDGQGDAEGFGYGPYFIPEGADLSEIEVILSRPDWTEDAINSAVENLNFTDGAAYQRVQEYRARLRRERNWCNETFA